MSWLLIIMYTAAVFWLHCVLPGGSTVLSWGFKSLAAAVRYSVYNPLMASPAHTHKQYKTKLYNSVYSVCDLESRSPFSRQIMLIVLDRILFGLLSFGRKHACLCLLSFVRTVLQTVCVKLFFFHLATWIIS